MHQRYTPAREDIPSLSIPASPGLGARFLEALRERFPARLVSQQGNELHPKVRSAEYVPPSFHWIREASPQRDTWGSQTRAQMKPIRPRNAKAVPRAAVNQVPEISP